MTEPRTMSSSFPSLRGHRLPRAASAARAAIGLERWHELASQADDAGFAERVAADPAGRVLLESIFGNSPFLGHCLLNEPAVLGSFLAEGGDSVCDELLAGLADRKSTRLNSSHPSISYAVFCLKKKKKQEKLNHKN